MWVREDSQEQGPGDGLAFLVTSSLVLLFLEVYRKDGSEEWSWLFPSPETTRGGCNLTEEQGQYRLWAVWAKGILPVLSIFIHHLCSLSFLPPAEGFVYTAQYLCHSSASAWLGWHPLSFLGKCPHFPWPFELGDGWAAEGPPAHTGASGPAEGAGAVLTRSTQWLQDAITTCYFQQF